MEFTASLDTTAKVITIGFSVFFVGITVWSIISIRKRKGDRVNTIYRIVMSATLLIAGGYSYFFSTKGYEIKGKTLIINTRHKDIPLNWMQINDARQVGADEMKGLTRTFGVGGVFGYSGHYHNTTIGDMTFYATQQKNWVLIHTASGEAIIMTPDQPDKFLHELTGTITTNN